jgi:hypothetical protein
MKPLADDMRPIEGKYYDICVQCGKTYELKEKDVLRFDGRHYNCSIDEPHAHPIQPIPVCYECLEMGNLQLFI